MSKKIQSIGMSLGYLLLFLTAQMAASLMGGWGLWLSSPQHQNLSVMEIVSANLLLLSALGNILFLFLALGITRRNRIKHKIKRDVQNLCSSSFVLSLLTILCFSLFWNGAFHWIPVLQKAAGNFQILTIHDNWILYGFVLYLLAPIAEEICFRGLILSKLRTSLSDISAVFISAALFGLAHAMTGNPATMLFAFIGGVIFALCYVLTGSLTAAIVVHAAGNLCDVFWSSLTGVPKSLQFCLLFLFGAGTIYLLPRLFQKTLRRKTTV